MQKKSCSFSYEARLTRKTRLETLKLFYGMNAMLAEGVRSGSEDNKTTFGD